MFGFLYKCLIQPDQFLTVNFCCPLFRHKYVLYLYSAENNNYKTHLASIIEPPSVIKTKQAIRSHQLPNSITIWAIKGKLTELFSSMLNPVTDDWIHI